MRWSDGSDDTEYEYSLTVDEVAVIREGLRLVVWDLGDDDEGDSIRARGIANRLLDELVP